MAPSGSESALGEAAFPAVTVRRSDRRYVDLIRGLNQRFVGQPDSVHLVGSTAQVVQLIQQAVQENKRISVRGGGHCYEDFVYNPYVQVVVEMTEMKKVYFDAEYEAFVVEAGATLLEVYESLYRLWGITVPAGLCSTVGVGGHISGGGWGMLCRQHGLSVDHLYAVEVVVVDAVGTARAVVATRKESDPNRDLWWAHTGGGGGNFGVVTRYWFRSPGATGAPVKLLPTPPKEVLVSAISWPWSEMTQDRFARLVKNFGAWHVANGAPGTRYAGLCSLLTLSHRSNGQLSMLTQSDATVPNAEGLLDDFIASVSKGMDVRHGAVTSRFGEHGPMPEFATPMRLPWLQATRRLGGTVGTSGNLSDPSLRADHHSAYMRRNFPASQIVALYEHLTTSEIDNPTAMAQLHSYGGMVNAVASSATASVHRDSFFKLVLYAQWSDSNDDAKYIGWLRNFYREMYADTGGVPVPNEVTDGCFINYPDIDLGDPRYNQSGVPWYTLYYKENYPRLQQIKRKWDPRDIFRHSQSIQLPSV